MQVLVTFRHIEATDALRHYAESKVERARKFLRRPIEAHVILSVIKHRHVAEITLSADHAVFNATEETADLYSAIDLAMGKIERQIKKHVTKLQSRKQSSVAEPPAPASEPRRAARPRVKAERVTLDSISVREAVRRLDQGEDGFVVFQNSASDAINVLYRRKDGSYGLIEPESAKA
jgi:ribosome hibernation promoting factor